MSCYGDLFVRGENESREKKRKSGESKIKKPYIEEDEKQNWRGGDTREKEGQK